MRNMIWRIPIQMKLINSIYEVRVGNVRIHTPWFPHWNCGPFLRSVLKTVCVKCWAKKGNRRFVPIGSGRNSFLVKNAFTISSAGGSSFFPSEKYDLYQLNKKLKFYLIMYFILDCINLIKDELWKHFYETIGYNVAIIDINTSFYQKQTIEGLS